jgi:DNA gyrase/topoisomerase IV subunit A
VPTRPKLVFFFCSERGIVYSLKAHQIPESSRIASGSPLLQLLSLPPGEKVTSVLPLSAFPEDEYLVMLTTKGTIKKTPLSAFESIRSKGIVAVVLVRALLSLFVSVSLQSSYLLNVVFFLSILSSYIHSLTSFPVFVFLIFVLSFLVL